VTRPSQGRDGGGSNPLGATNKFARPLRRSDGKSAGVLRALQGRSPHRAIERASQASRGGEAIRNAVDCPTISAPRETRSRRVTIAPESSPDQSRQINHFPPNRILAKDSLQVGPGGFPPHARRRLDAAERPAQLAEGNDLLLLCVAQEIGHGGVGSTAPAPRQCLERLPPMAAFQVSIYGRGNSTRLLRVIFRW
jgi:hypothetical protein